MTTPQEIEAAARAMCELHIRTVRRWDTDPDRLEKMIAAAVDYAWQEWVPHATAALTAAAAIRSETAESVGPVARQQAEIVLLRGILGDMGYDVDALLRSARREAFEEAAKVPSPAQDEPQ